MVQSANASHKQPVGCAVARSPDWGHSLPASLTMRIRSSDAYNETGGYWLLYRPIQACAGPSQARRSWAIDIFAQESTRCLLQVLMRFAVQAARSYTISGVIL